MTAPFDGIVSAHLVSVGELVGAASPTQLATIVQLDPIYVNFNVSEQDVLRIRAEAAPAGTDGQRHQAICRSRSALQTETGYPHKGKLDYVAPTINQSTGTLAVRGILPNADRVLLPGYFVRVRVPFDRQKDALLVPDVALGSDQAGRYVLVVNGDNVVEQRKVEIGPLDGESARDRERPEGRTTASSPPGCCARSPARRSIRSCRRSKPPAASAK